jgi:hypothetical protein
MTKDASGNDWAHSPPETSGKEPHELDAHCAKLFQICLAGNVQMST